MSNLDRDLPDDEILATKASREAYAKKIGSLDTGYIDILAYIRLSQKEPNLTDSEIIDRLDLSWDKKPEGYYDAN